MIRAGVLIALLAGAATAQSAPATEDDFITGMGKLPTAAFTTSIEAAFKDKGCAFDFSGGEDPFIRAVTKQLAKTVGYTGPITDKSVDAVDDLGEDAIDAMMSDGRVEVDRSTFTARLKGCQ